MEIILIQDVATLGYKGDIIKVRPGYGRNFLIPKGMAVVANESNKKVVAENMKQAKHKLAKIKTDAESIANKLSNETLNLSVKTGTTNKIFGSVTTLQIAHLLKDKGYEVDRRKISIPEEIKFLGTYSATVELHKEVKTTITINVVAEEKAA